MGARGVHNESGKREKGVWVCGDDGEGGTADSATHRGDVAERCQRETDDILVLVAQVSAVQRHTAASVQHPPDTRRQTRLDSLLQRVDD